YIISSTYYILFFSPSFFFTATATTEIYTLSLHDALPIFFTMARSMRMNPLKKSLLWIQNRKKFRISLKEIFLAMVKGRKMKIIADRKSTRLNSSHVKISYAVFCLKKKKKKKTKNTHNTRK